VTPFWRRESQQLAKDVDVDLDLARAEAESALPEGWRLDDSDREHYQTGEHGFNSWAAFAAGPGGEVVAAVALTEAESWRQLARRLRGDLEVTEGWAPPLTDVEGGQL
jgi:hypothetical protein